MKYEVYFMRHGKTYLNKYNRMQGWSDAPLTDDGIEVAQKAGEALKDEKFDKAFATDTTRAIHTLDIVIEKSNTLTKIDKYLPEFREVFYGYFEGDNGGFAWDLIGGPHGYPSYNELVTNAGLDQTFDWMKEADPYGDAENHTEFWSRIDKGFDYLDSVANEGDKILVVSHGTTITSLGKKYGDGSFEVKEAPANASLTHLTREDGNNIIDSYGKVIG